jgi:hypothetical protein
MIFLMVSFGLHNSYGCSYISQQFPKELLIYSYSFFNISINPLAISCGLALFPYSSPITSINFLRVYCRLLRISLQLPMYRLSISRKFPREF